jgi:hypothetical protein
MMGKSGASAVLDTLAAVLALKEPRERPLGEALGIKLRRVVIASPVESFEGDLPEGPFGKADFRINKETNGGVLVLRLREKMPSLMEGQLRGPHFGVEPRLISYPDVPPEGATSHIYEVGDKEAHLQFASVTKRLLVAAVHFKEYR